MALTDYPVLISLILFLSLLLSVSAVFSKPGLYELYEECNAGSAVWTGTAVAHIMNRGWEQGGDPSGYAQTGLMIMPDR
ncbi:hypothetical protein CS542_05925 [Pedobacter sp. IW39]|nr:hypothetical protein CS542_05925 [Pedobacter sp. IW39]